MFKKIFYERLTDEEVKKIETFLLQKNLTVIRNALRSILGIPKHNSGNTKEASDLYRSLYNTKKISSSIPLSLGNWHLRCIDRSKVIYPAPQIAGYEPSRAIGKYSAIDGKDGFNKYGFVIDHGRFEADGGIEIQIRPYHPVLDEREMKYEYEESISRFIGMGLYFDKDGGFVSHIQYKFDRMKIREYNNDLDILAKDLLFGSLCIAGFEQGWTTIKCIKTEYSEYAYRKKGGGTIESIAKSWRMEDKGLYFQINKDIFLKSLAQWKPNQIEKMIQGADQLYGIRDIDGMDNFNLFFKRENEFTGELINTIRTIYRDQST